MSTLDARHVRVGEDIAHRLVVRGMCEGRVARLVDERGVGAVPQKQLERGAMAKPRGEHERCEPCFAKMEGARA